MCGLAPENVGLGEEPADPKEQGADVVRGECIYDRLMKSRPSEEASETMRHKGVERNVRQVPDTDWYTSAAGLPIRSVGIQFG